VSINEPANNVAAGAVLYETAQPTGKAAGDCPVFQHPTGAETHPSLRHRRDRQRKLALQKSRLTQENLSSTEPRSPWLRNPDHMWTAPWQALFDATALWRLLSYVRPVDAKPQLAGHDDIRVSGFSSAPRARGAGRGSEWPGLRFAGSSSPHFALPTSTPFLASLFRLASAMQSRSELPSGRVHPSS
jgi:hypothetical protein